MEGKLLGSKKVGENVLTKVCVYVADAGRSVHLSWWTKPDQTIGRSFTRPCDCKKPTMVDVPDEVIGTIADGLTRL